MLIVLIIIRSYVLLYKYYIVWNGLNDIVIIVVMLFVGLNDNEVLFE